MIYSTTDQFYQSTGIFPRFKHDGTYATTLLHALTQDLALAVGCDHMKTIAIDHDSSLIFYTDTNGVPVSSKHSLKVIGAKLTIGLYHVVVGTQHPSDKAKTAHANILPSSLLFGR